MTTPTNGRDGAPIPPKPLNPPTSKSGVSVPLSLSESAVLSALSDLIVNQSDRTNTGLASLGNRFDGLVDVELKTDERALTRHAELLRGMIERFDMVLNAIDRVADRTDSDDTMAIAEQKAISAEYDRGVAAGRASIQDAMVREQREIRENGFDDGVKIGASEREAELLEAGWTPPGAIVCPNGEVHELEVSTGPTDYEVWRDALMIAGSQRNRRQLETGTIRVDAEWFWEQLQDVPVLKNDDGTDTVHDRIDGDETSWGPMATIDPTNTPLNEPPA